MDHIDRFLNIYNNLKKCPFCGSQLLTISIERDDTSYVECSICCGRGPRIPEWGVYHEYSDNERIEDAARGWNQRPRKSIWTPEPFKSGKELRVVKDCVDDGGSWESYKYMMIMRDDASIFEEGEWDDSEPYDEDLDTEEEGSED